MEFETSAAQLVYYLSRWVVGVGVKLTWAKLPTKTLTLILFPIIMKKLSLIPKHLDLDTLTLIILPSTLFCN